MASIVVGFAFFLIVMIVLILGIALWSSDPSGDGSPADDDWTFGDHIHAPVRPTPPPTTDAFNRPYPPDSDFGFASSATGPDDA